MRIKLFFSGICALFLFTNTKAQNLVFNPSFELVDSSKCKGATVNKCIYHWWHGNGGGRFVTSDSNGVCWGCPNSRHLIYPTKQTARSGSFFSAIFLGYEYINGVLNKTLLKDSVYEISMYISFDSVSTVAAKSINVSFIRNKNVLNYVLDPEDIFPFTTKLKVGRKKSTRGKWTKITGLYKAKGGEKYIYIGMQDTRFIFNYYSRKLGRGIRMNKGSKMKQHYRTVQKEGRRLNFFEKLMLNLQINSTYFIDDVSVKPLNGSDFKEKGKTENPDSIIQIQKFVLEEHEWLGWKDTLNVEYKNRVRSILPEIKASLDSGESRVSIIGHSDSTGDKYDDFYFAKVFARKVKEFMISEGINEQKIESYSEASFYPIYPNSSLDYKRKNKRIEFVIYRRVE